MMDSTGKQVMVRSFIRQSINQSINALYAGNAFVFQLLYMQPTCFVEELLYTTLIYSEHAKCGGVIFRLQEESSLGPGHHAVGNENIFFASRRKFSAYRQTNPPATWRTVSDT